MNCPMVVCALGVVGLLSPSTNETLAPRADCEYGLEQYHVTECPNNSTAEQHLCLAKLCNEDEEGCAKCDVDETNCITNPSGVGGTLACEFVDAPD